jgi:SAM-dependent methyltransferase
MRRRLFFNWRYLFGRPPWDSGVPPPELLSFIQGHPPGRAIDLGCGTGTNVLILAQNGWDVTGVDYSPLAIRRARRKIAQDGREADLRVYDVTNLSAIEPPFDLALDIGCFHSLTGSERVRYVTELARLIRPGGTFLLYTFLTRDGRSRPGLLDETELKTLFDRDFELARIEHGFFHEQTSAWLTLIRRS